MTLADSLEALVVEHDRIGSPLREYLGSGTPRADTEAAVVRLGLSPPSELLDLFAWHGPRDDLGDDSRIDWFWPARPFLLPEAVEQYRTAIEIGGVTAADLEEADRAHVPRISTNTGFWRSDWFPILGGSPETYAIECRLDGEHDATGPIWRVNWHPDPGFETVQVAPSLADFVDRVVELFRAGAYAWDARYRAVMTVDDVFDRLGLGGAMRPWR